MSNYPCDPNNGKLEQPLNLSLRDSIPMGVSQWREYGKLYGYWDFFKREVKEELLEEAKKMKEFMKKSPQKASEVKQEGPVDKVSFVPHKFD